MRDRQGDKAGGQWSDRQRACACVSVHARIHLLELSLLAALTDGGSQRARGFKELPRGPSVWKGGNSSLFLASIS